MDSRKTLFYIYITDGYSFRNTIGIVKSETDYATMILSPDTIEISFANGSKSVSHMIELNTRLLNIYRYKILDSDGNLAKEFPIVFETNQMFNTTKGIGRRDSIVIFWVVGDNKLNVKPMKANTKDPGRVSSLFVDIVNMEASKCPITNFYKNEPNVRVQAKDFADICSQANTLKCSTLEIVGENNSVTFRSMMPNNAMASFNRFVSQNEITNESDANSGTLANMEEIDNIIENLRTTDGSFQSSSGLSLNIIKNEDLLTVKVPITTVKALSKIHNISPNGSFISFFFAEGKPTKIESPIGTYGTYSICLRNNRV